MKMSGSQMILFLRAEFVEFLSRRRSGANSHPQFSSFHHTDRFRCHVTNGKQLWLCPEHSARVGSVSEDAGSAAPSAVTYSKPSTTGATVDDESDDDSYVMEEEEGNGDLIYRGRYIPPNSLCIFEKEKTNI